EDKRENPADPSNSHFTVIFQQVSGANCGTRTRFLWSQPIRQPIEIAKIISDEIILRISDCNSTFGANPWGSQGS
ncbi:MULTISPECIES: hypothetical protein, partial [unclassified Acetobacter]|uniref:hypothetical protein n=1 Tax=unclassified Acetobacter TaxID=2628570 RepID=UPI001EE2B1CF